MTSMDWVEDKLEQRRSIMRLRLAAGSAAMARRHRVWDRDVARAALIGSLLVLGILLVEIARRAMVLL